MGLFRKKRETFLTGEQTGKSILEFMQANPGSILGYEAQIKALNRMIEADAEIDRLKLKISVMEQSRAR